jgi:hypothetical protein
MTHHRSDSGHSFQVQQSHGSEGRFSRWVHEHVLEAVQRRLDENPQAMRQRRETVEHPFGTFKARMGATHFLMKRLKNVRTEMALSVLAYNLTRVPSAQCYHQPSPSSASRTRRRSVSAAK